MIDYLAHRAYLRRAARRAHYRSLIRKPGIPLLIIAAYLTLLILNVH